MIFADLVTFNIFRNCGIIKIITYLEIIIYLEICCLLIAVHKYFYLGSRLGEENSAEKKIKTVECQFITLVDFTPGMLQITTKNLHFIPEPFTTGTYICIHIYSSKMRTFVKSFSNYAI